MTKEIELLPCPFCNGKPYQYGPNNPGCEYWIGCQSCQASSIMRSNEEAARSAWNTRAQPQESKQPAAWRMIWSDGSETYYGRDWKPPRVMPHPDCKLEPLYLAGSRPNHNTET